MSVSNLSNITNFLGFLQEANNQASGWFWSGMNIMVFLVLLVTLSTGFGFEAGVFAAGFVSIILSVFLMFLGLQSFLVTGIVIGLVLFLFIVIIFSNRYS